jgi:hypothetical protein
MEDAPAKKLRASPAVSAALFPEPSDDVPAVPELMATAAWPERLGNADGRCQIRSIARKRGSFPLISTAAAVTGDEGDEEWRIRRRGRQSSGDARDGVAEARAAVQAAWATEQRRTGRAKTRERGGGRVFSTGVCL